MPNLDSTGQAAAATRPDVREVVDLLTSLVGIDSTNPSLVPGGVGEEKIAHFITGWLTRAGIRAELHEVAPRRPNVVARIPGTEAGRSLILNAHVDTVGTEGMTAPFQPVVKGDRLYGRGAYDMKGGLAAVMLAARTIAQAGGAGGDVVVTAVADEEYASLGTEAIVASMRADAAIVTEPTSLRLCAAHKGFVWIEVETTGRSAHGSKPDLGIDAISHMGRVLVDLEAYGAALAGSAPHPLVGTGSIHASLIQGGQELSSYPAGCTLRMERRTIPGESPEAVLREVTTMLEARAAQDPSFSAEGRLLFAREPFEVSREEPIVRAVQTAARDVLGAPPQVYGDTPWMDAALLAAAGIPTVVFGPGGTGAHAVTEYALVSDIAACAEVLLRTIIDFCR